MTIKIKHYRSRPRSLNGQIRRMEMRWPDFKLMPNYDNDDIIVWIGELTGFQRKYQVGIIWNYVQHTTPHVALIDPELLPREGGTYEDIPHLMFTKDNPKKSGLCLFDPEGKEWTSHMLIADTTLPWAAKWLYYYELWFDDGIWRGGGVGPESVAKMREQDVYRATEEHTANTPR